MPRAHWFPNYPKRPHQSGQARLTIQGVCHYLGVFGSEVSHAEYERLRAEWRRRTFAAESVVAARLSGPVRTIKDLVAHWLIDANRTYRNDAGDLRKEYSCI